MFINPDLQDSLLVKDVSTVAKYLKKATQKYPSSRDTRYLISLLINLPKVDRHLMSLIRYRKLAVSSYIPTIKFADNVQITATEEKQLAEMKARWMHSNMHSVIDTIMTGRLIGMGAVKLDWGGYSDTFHHFVQNKTTIPATDLDYDLDYNDNLKLVETDTKSQNFSRIDLDKQTTIIVRDNPLSGFDEDFPGGLLRANLIHIILKYWDFFTWANTNEKYADPPRFATYEQHLEKYVPEILQQLAKMGTDSYGAFMKGVDVKILEAIKDGAITSHVELEASVNRGMNLSIAGQYSASDPQKGHSYATSKVGYQISEDVTYDDLVFIEHQISRQYLMNDYLLNYGEPKNGFPILFYQKRKIKDAEAHSRIVTDYIANGIPVHKDDIYPAIDFKKVDADDPNAFFPKNNIIQNFG